MSLPRQSIVEQPKPRPQHNSPEILARKGWSAKAAAEFLNTDFGHLTRVASGTRQSERLMRRLIALPDLTKRPTA